RRVGTEPEAVSESSDRAVLLGAARGEFHGCRRASVCRLRQSRAGLERRRVHQQHRPPLPQCEEATESKVSGAGRTLLGYAPAQAAWRPDAVRGEWCRPRNEGLGGVIGERDAEDRGGRTAEGLNSAANSGVGETAFQMVGKRKGEVCLEKL